MYIIFAENWYPTPRLNKREVSSQKSLLGV